MIKELIFSTAVVSYINNINFALKTCDVWWCISEVNLTTILVGDVRWKIAIIPFCYCKLLKNK